MQAWLQHPLVRRILQFAGIVALILLAAAFNQRLQELGLKNTEVIGVRAQATSVIQTQQALQTLEAYAHSDQAAVDWARGEAHYIKNGDRPVIPVTGGGNPSLQLPPLQPTPTPASNWSLWMRVFFGP